MISLNGFRVVEFVVVVGEREVGEEKEKVEKEEERDVDCGVGG